MEEHFSCCVTVVLKSYDASIVKTKYSTQIQPLLHIHITGGGKNLYFIDASAIMSNQGRSIYVSLYIHRPHVGVKTESLCRKNHCGDLAITLIAASISLQTHTHTHRLHVCALSQSHVVRSLIHILAECLASFSSADVGMLLCTQCKTHMLTFTHKHVLIHNVWSRSSSSLSLSHTNS